MSGRGEGRPRSCSGRLSSLTCRWRRCQSDCVRQNMDAGFVYYLVRCHRQRRLFCDLPAKRRRGACPSDWEQEARLLRYLGHPYGAVAVQTHICETPMRGNARILLNRVMADVRCRPAMARFLLHGRLEPWGGLGSRPAVGLGWQGGVSRALATWLVLVNSGLLHWDLLHWAVELWS